MNDGTRISVVVFPAPPQRSTSGRYGEVTWTYQEYVGNYEYVGRKYEIECKQIAIKEIERLHHENKSLRDEIVGLRMGQTPVVVIERTADELSEPPSKRLTRLRALVGWLACRDSESSRSKDDVLTDVAALDWAIARLRNELPAPAPNDSRPEIINLLRKRAHLHDEFRLAESRTFESRKRGDVDDDGYGEEMSAFDAAHNEVMGWVEENAGELLLLLETPAYETPAVQSSLEMVEKLLGTFQEAHRRPFDLQANAAYIEARRAVLSLMSTARLPAAGWVSADNSLSVDDESSSPSR